MRLACICALSALSILPLPEAQAGPRTRAQFQSAALQDNWQGPYRRPGAEAAPSRAPQESSSTVTAQSARPRQDVNPVMRPAPAPTPATSPRLPSDISREHDNTPYQANATRGRQTSTQRTPQGGQASFTPRHAVDYVLDTYSQNGVDIDGRGSVSVVELYRHVQQRGAVYHGRTPAVGDLVFFHNTHDQNRDQRNNDWYSHVGVVEQVMGDGTIIVISWRNGSINRDSMNLTRPREVEYDGRVINTPLRAPANGDPQFTQYLSGELFAGFGSLLGNASEVVVLDSWRP